MWSNGIARPIPRSKKSMQVKITRKINAEQRKKKNWDGLYKVFAPGSTIGKISPTTSVNKEPKRQEVRVRNSDIAKLRMRNERGLELGKYIDRRPKKSSRENMRAENQQSQKRLKKDLGSKKIKRNRNQPDDVSVISNGRSCISTSINVARALRMQIPKRNPKHDDAFQNRPDLTQTLHFSPSVPMAAPPTQPTTAGPSV